MEINLQEELDKELQDIEELNTQIQQVDQHKMELVRQVFRKEGIIQFLQTKLEQEKEVSNGI